MVKESDCVMVVSKGGIGGGGDVGGDNVRMEGSLARRMDDKKAL